MRIRARRQAWQGPTVQQHQPPPVQQHQQQRQAHNVQQQGAPQQAQQPQPAAGPTSVDAVDKPRAEQGKRSTEQHGATLLDGLSVWLGGDRQTTDKKAGGFTGLLQNLLPPIHPPRKFQNGLPVAFLELIRDGKLPVGVR